MKLTRERILEILSGKKQGVTYKEIMEKGGARNARRKLRLSALLKKMDKAGEVEKRGDRFFAVNSARKKQSGGWQQGSAPDPRNDWKRISEKHDLPGPFPQELDREADKARRNLDKEIASRPRAKGWIVTIDSESAKDLDDAVSVSKKGRNYRLSVHIADVSWFVTKGSKLDKEAMERGTSVYLLDKVIPMFPESLSNDLCSLNADSDKLCFSAEMEINSRGEVVNTEFRRTVVRVDRRLSYKEVEKVLNGAPDPDRKKIQQLAKLAKVLRKERFKQGSLAFEVPQLHMELDRNGVPVEVDVPERMESEMIVEEFMLCANQQVAAFLEEAGHAIFRIHENPDEEKLTEFYKYANKLGVNIKKPRETSPLSMQRILDSIRSNPSAAVLNSLLIRTMQKAVYSTDNPGHFGLGFTTYTHFTSPIRRYPDLIVHRLLAAAVNNRRGYNHRALQRIAKQSTEREQRAVDAEREILRIKGARYLDKKKKQVFEGRITSVVPWGCYITLLPYGLDGMLHVSQLRDDRYYIDSYGHSLVGVKRGKSLTIGDTIRVRVLRVNVEKGFIDLLPVKNR